MVTSRMPFERVLPAALTLALVGACDRGHRESPPSKATQAPAPTSTPVAKSGAAVTGCTLAPIPLTLPVKPKRLVAIGDLHGDLAATRAALKAGGLINDSDAWTGGDTVVVQTGDILDRGDDESKIYVLLDKLTAEAKAAGGDIILLDGNHELMQGALDFRYVTPGGMRDFGGDRAKAFAPGGEWAKKLARYNVAAIIDGNVFSHAGVLDKWTTALDDQNLKARCWLDGQAGGPQDAPLVLTSDDSPVWTRVYGMPGAVDCAALDGVLAKLGAKRMIVGHTPQRGGITSDCGDKLWRIDVGLATYYGGPIEVLEVGATPRVLKGTR